MTKESQARSLTSSPPDTSNLLVCTSSGVEQVLSGLIAKVASTAKAKCKQNVIPT